VEEFSILSEEKRGKTEGVVVVRKREVTGCLVEFVIWPVKRLGYTFTFRVVICGYVRAANNKGLKTRASGKGKL
jgi:hypothetical protein